LNDADTTFGSDGKGAGLAQQRTELAWSRSGLSVAVTVAVVLRRLWPLTGEKSVVALVLIATGSIIWVLGIQIGKRKRFRVDADFALVASTCRMLSIGTVALAAAAFVVGVVVPV
jgi:hypothetical protein